MQDDRDGGSVIQGECHVETVASSSSRVLLDGLRLRLDLRILPRSSSNEPGAARVATAKLTAYPLGLPTYQRRAIWLGLGALALAIGVWLASAPSAVPRPSPPDPRKRPGETSSEPSTPPARPAPTNAAARSEPPSPAVEVVPSPAPMRSRAPERSTATADPRAPIARPASRRPDAAVPLIPKAAASGRPLAAQPPAADMLELFGDTK